MDSIKELAKLVARYIKGDEKKTKAYDTSATVKRIANGIAYVQIPGGVSETPVKLTIDAKKGDTVQVRVANGTAWLVGNRTAPPTDDTTANIAKTKATTAEKVATVAEEAAGEAQVKANAATTQAAAAKQIADNTEQHFWFTETGADTGAHITEVTQEEWNDPLDPNYQSGGNLLARSNGIAIRDGLTELASFGQDVTLGATSGRHLVIDSSALKFKTDNNTTPLKMEFKTTYGGARKEFDMFTSNSVVDNRSARFLLQAGGDVATDQAYIEAKWDASHSASLNLIASANYGLARIYGGDLEIMDGGIKVEGHASAIGTMYVGTGTNVNITSTDVDTYVAGSSITLPIGKYIVNALSSFPSNSTEAIRRMQIYNSTSSASLAIASNWDRYWVSHNLTRICNVTTNNTVLQCRVSAGVALNTCYTLIEAIRIA